MALTQIKKISLIGLTSLALSGCDSIPFFDNTPDYKSAGRSRPLEVPPDLTSVSASDTYSVPGSTTYSSYNQNKPVLEQENLLPNSEIVRLERAGSQRWLVVKAPAEKIWPVVREFWTDLGFAVRVENPETGVMETEWVDPSGITKDGNEGYIDKFQRWMDKLNTLQNRQKFRTRLDRGENETTEIYLSHRSVAENLNDDKLERVRTSAGTYITGYKLESKLKQEELERSDAEDIDAELMRRLMVRLGVPEIQSKTIMATAKVVNRAQINKEANGDTSLTVNDPFDRAWRRVGLALDRVGFVVEDRDRSRGVFFVRYTDVNIDDGAVQKKEKGLIDALIFWDDDEKKPASSQENNAEIIDKEGKKKEEQSFADKLKFWEIQDKDKPDVERLYLVNVTDKEDGTANVFVTNRNGERNRSVTAQRIVNLLFDQLK